MLIQNKYVYIQFETYCVSYDKGLMCIAQKVMFYIYSYVFDNVTNYTNLWLVYYQEQDDGFGYIMSHDIGSMHVHLYDQEKLLETNLTTWYFSYIF